MNLVRISTTRGVRWVEETLKPRIKIKKVETSNKVDKDGDKAPTKKEGEQTPED
jgi:hypothetical protein